LLDYYVMIADSAVLVHLAERRNKT
jgi:hypothetical protein